MMTDYLSQQAKQTKLSKYMIAQLQSMKIPVPNYVWEIPEIDMNQQRQLALNLINICLRDCSAVHYSELMSGKCYLAFDIIQDEDSVCINGYIKSMDSSVENIIKNLVPDNLLCHIRSSTRSIFWQLSLTQWKNKSITCIDEISLYTII
jgi:hypothetical protein